MEQETIEMQEVEMTEQLQHKAPTVQQQRAVTTTATPGDLLRYAMESGADLDRLEKLMQMQLAWEANEARKAYVAAMVEFKKKPPEIFKDKHVSFDTQKGMTEYDHATLGNVVEDGRGEVSAINTWPERIWLNFSSDVVPENMRMKIKPIGWIPPSGIRISNTSAPISLRK
jgi:hypothetical protein